MRQASSLRAQRARRCRPLVMDSSQWFAPNLLDTAAQAGVTADLFAILKTVPVA